MPILKKINRMFGFGFGLVDSWVVGFGMYIIARWFVEPEKVVWKCWHIFQVNFGVWLNKYFSFSVSPTN